MKLYNEIPTLEILAGDTLPTFAISVETIAEDGTAAAADLTGCAMYLIVAQQGKELEPVLTRLCSTANGGFSVRLNSADTAGMSGMYSMHFALYSGDNIIYKKLAGNLHVTAAATVLEDSGSGSLPTVSDLTLHLSDTTVHITAQERIGWNACVDGLAALSETVGAQGEAITVLQAQTALNAAPMQDASVEGRYMLFAEYTFPQAANYESSDLTLLIRNRGVNTAAEDGILRVRLRYGKAAAAFQYAQSYWMQNSGIDPAKFILCCNNSTGTAQLWLDASTAYAGYICKVLDMGTSAQVVDLDAWTLYSPTSGAAELPPESDGWTNITSAAAAAE